MRGTERGRCQGYEQGWGKFHNYRGTPGTEKKKVYQN